MPSLFLVYLAPCPQKGRATRRMAVPTPFLASKTHAPCPHPTRSGTKLRQVHGQPTFFKRVNYLWLAASTGLLLVFCVALCGQTHASYPDQVLSMFKTWLRATLTSVRTCGQVRARSGRDTARSVPSAGSCGQQKLAPASCTQCLPAIMWLGL